MKKILLAAGFLIVQLLILLPSSVWAQRHEDCAMCHKNAEKKDYTLIVSPDTKSINPHTNRPFGMRDAFCMGCHKDNIDVTTLHSVGIKPKNAILPKEALGFKGQEKELTCEGCHDPHLEENYMYLRWKASPGEGGLNYFCGKCHPQKGSARR